MSHPNPFAAGRIDRVSHRRLDDEWLSRARESEDSRITLVWRSQSLVFLDDPPAIGLLPVPTPDSELLPPRDSWVLLGVDQDRPLFAVDVSHVEDPVHELGLKESAEFQDLRQLAGLLEPAEGSLAAYARAMMTWHDKHRFCGSCGSATDNTQGGHLRRCSNEDCGASIFPRTDPAVIMLVVDGDRCLLGRQERWPEGMFSTLAGFVEPGESLEDAVRREVEEESGLLVDNCRYSSSQPWPFPSSLMLGFYADYTSGEISVDGQEIEEAHWFTRQQLLERQIRLPGKLSIARRLVDDWLRG